MFNTFIPILSPKDTHCKWCPGVVTTAALCFVRHSRELLNHRVGITGSLRPLCGRADLWAPGEDKVTVSHNIVFFQAVFCSDTPVSLMYETTEQMNAALCLTRHRGGRAIAVRGDTFICSVRG